MARHVALLRGINVGGKRTVGMKDLKEVFEQAGMTDVRTYINSGNVIFSPGRSRARLAETFERAVADRFGFEVPVLVRDLPSIDRVVQEMPDAWRNDASMRCDVMFLWEAVDDPSVLDTLRFDPRIEDVRYVPGAVLWAVDREQLTRSGMMDLPGTDLYRRMTIRNCNTVRKLVSLMEAMP